jgi:hypothetical protein
MVVGMEEVHSIFQTVSHIKGSSGMGHDAVTGIALHLI